MRCTGALLASIATWLLLLRVISAQPPAPTGSYQIYTAAGDGSTSYSGDGTSAINAGIKGPLGTTRRDSNGDGSEATAAGITGPKFSRFDGTGSNYYISETDSNKVRLITGNIPTATLTTSLRYVITICNADSLAPLLQFQSYYFILPVP